MDTDTLVENQIDDGQRFLARLALEKIPLLAACWVKPAAEDRWSLYIATPLVDEKGAAAAYREIYRHLRRLQPLWFTDSEVKLVGARHPIARGMREIAVRYPGRIPTRSRQPFVGDLPTEEVYAYPIVPSHSRPKPETRRLKVDVEQTIRPEDALLSDRERVALQQLLASGLSMEEADRWVRRKRAPAPPRPPIPAGTVVTTTVAAHWGDAPEDDSNPLLMAEGPSGERGLVFMSDTEPARETH